MDLDCPHLSLAPHWAEENDRRRIVLVRGVDAVRLCKKGDFEKVKSGDATRELHRVSRSIEREISDFVSRTSIDAPSARRPRLRELVKLVVDYIKHGIFVPLRRTRAERWDDDDGSMEQRRLVREIERGTRGRLWQGGRKYKLVVGADVAGIPDRNSYEVLRHDEAVRVLGALSKQFAAKPDVATKIAVACTKLSPDWRPPMRPKGLVVLRKIAAQAVAAAAMPQVITPSQMRAMMQQQAPAQNYQFAWDQPFSQRQWVNLPNSWGVVAFGDMATLTGHVEPRAAGQVVSFTLLPDPANPPEATGAALGEATATSDANGKVQVELAFPIYPGAKFKVAGKTSSMASPVESEPITVWRRVYYQITEMAPAPDGMHFNPPPDMISALEGAFNPVWIELALGTKSKASTPYKAHMTPAERYAVESSLRSSAVDNRSPYKMNIVMIDTADIVAEDEWKSPIAGGLVETPPFIKWKYEPAVISAEYEVPAIGWLPLANVQVVDLPHDYAKVTATIPGSPASSMKVRIKYRFQKGHAGGWGGTAGTVFMCIGRQRRRNPSSPTGVELQQALTHEIGHALGLVPSTASWHAPDPRDPEPGLRHCGALTSTGVPRCLMWFELGGSGERLRFCRHNPPNDCAHFLLRADLSNIRWI